MVKEKPKKKAGEGPVAGDYAVFQTFIFGVVNFLAFIYKVTDAGENKIYRVSRVYGPDFKPPASPQEELSNKELSHWYRGDDFRKELNEIALTLHNLYDLDSMSFDAFNNVFVVKRFLRSKARFPH